MRKQKRVFWRRIFRWGMAVCGVALALTVGFLFHFFSDTPAVIQSVPLPSPHESAALPEANVATSVEKGVPEPLGLPRPPDPPLVLSSETVEQGDTFAVGVAEVASGTPHGTFLGKELAFFGYGGGVAAMLGIPVGAKADIYPLSVALSDGEILTRYVTVGERKFPVTELKTTPELEAQGHTPTNIERNVAAENAVLYAAFISGPEPNFSTPFVYPLEHIVVVGAFGNIRVSDGVSIRHMGVDLEAAEGTPVRAMNGGVVRLARRFTDYGNTLLIDHGAHIFSLYLHLSVFNVAEGETVRRGETIALSGNTGYSLAPHLHFSVNVGGVSVDGLRFIEAANGVLREN